MKIHVILGTKTRWIPISQVQKCHAYQNSDFLNLVECEVNGKRAHIAKAFETLGNANEVAVSINILNMYPVSNRKD